MASYSAAVEQLIEAFGRLPGVGAKTAERLTHHILKCSPEEALALAEAIRQVKERVRHCETCFNLTDFAEPLCTICRDPRRDTAVVCVVEQPRDLMALESAGT
jgi:recombination protein RecR